MVAKEKEAKTIPTPKQEPNRAMGDPSSELILIRLSAIRPSPTNPRKRVNTEQIQELAASLKQTGMVSPLIVRENPNERSKYELVAGERRWRAASIAGMELVPCLIREMTDKQVLEVQCVENDQRVDVTPVERARAYKYLRDTGATIAEIAQRVGRSETAIREALALTVLPDGLLDLVDAGHIAPTTAAILVRVPDRLREDAARALAMCLIFLPKLTDDDRKPNGSYGWKTIAKRYEGNAKGPTLQEARQLMSSLVRDLRTAIWDLDAPNIAETIACTKCPNRERDTSSGGKDTCLDADCYTRKHDASRRSLPVIETPPPKPTKQPEAPSPVEQPKTSLLFVKKKLSESSTAKCQRWAVQEIGNPFAINPDSDAWFAVVKAMTMYLADMTMPYTPDEIRKAEERNLIVMATEIVANLAKFHPLPNVVEDLAKVGLDVNKLGE